ncbi:MAG: hypothetical protein Tp1124SUR1244132_7 [Prokaryotic dsDNA virus sp.]|nr:MAG: hypothetical protein Tp1124SUR1244132_7 [Prokaryotic dsDNA virus sp.]|tara:strand:+ start:3423 stop:3605 length:183 start_codon:yes stop_codon:yes gene_type:complete
MKYLLKQDLHIKDNVLKAGDIVDAKDIPQKSIKWLLEQEIIVKVDKKMQEKILQSKEEEE